MQAHPILLDIESFCKAHRMAESTFGRQAVKDWRFVNELRGSKERGPRRLWPETEKKIRHFMVTYRADNAQAADAA